MRADIHYITIIRNIFNNLLELSAILYSGIAKLYIACGLSKRIRVHELFDVPIVVFKS